MEQIALNASEGVLDVYESDENKAPATRLYKPEIATQAAKRRRLKNNIKGWVFSVWPFLGWLIFAGIPFAVSILISFLDLHNLALLDVDWKNAWTFENYKWIFKFEDLTFWFSLRTTLYYCLSLPIGIVLGLGTSVLLTRGVKLTRLFRTIMFIPNVCSVVAVSTMWRLFFAGNKKGVINALLIGIFGKDFECINFLGSPYLFMPTVIFTTTWSAGSGSIMFQAALENVNKSLIEAAEIDGASKSRVFFRITLPAISPTTFYVLTMNTISALQAMANIQVLSGNTSAGGKTPQYPVKNPGDPQYSASLTTVYLIYYYTFGFGGSPEHLRDIAGGPGLAAACAWVLAILIFILTRINFKLGDYWVCYDN